jgi:pimeloyl-[acyl-carrier protein] synthase
MNSEAAPSDPVPDLASLLRDDSDGTVLRRTRSGIVLLTRYDEVLEGLKNKALSNRPGPFALVHKRNIGIHVAADVANNLIAFQDRPEHVAPRQALMQAFGVALAEFRPTIGALAHHLVETMHQRTDMELMRDFSSQFASLSVCRLMGLPDQDSQRIRGWSASFFQLFHAIPGRAAIDALDRSLVEFRAYFASVVHERLARPRDDFVSLLLAAQNDGTRLPIPSVIDNCMLLAADGVENVQTGLASSVATLLAHPEELDKLKAAIIAGADDGSLMRAAINECLRFESPGQYQLRNATADTVIAGKPIRRHEIVALCFGAANRDPSVYAAPNLFQIERSGPRHLAFGAGYHGCLGSALVESEFAAAFRALFGKDRRIALRDPEIRWQRRVGHRWPEALNLVAV